MKDFVVYTLLRLGMFAGAFGITFGIWAAFSDEVSLTWVLVISFIASGLASYFLLHNQREAFARRVDERARRATSKFEQMRSAEDD